MKRLLAALLLTAGLIVTAAPPASALTQTKAHTFNFTTYSVRVAVTVNYTQSGTATLVQSRVICITSGATHTGTPKLYDIDTEIKRTSGGVIERAQYNAQSGSSTCHTWTMNESVSGLSPTVGVRWDVNALSRPDQTWFLLFYL